MSREDMQEVDKFNYLHGMMDGGIGNEVAYRVLGGRKV